MVINLLGKDLNQIIPVGIPKVYISWTRKVIGDIFMASQRINGHGVRMLDGPSAAQINSMTEAVELGLMLRDRDNPAVGLKIVKFLEEHQELAAEIKRNVANSYFVALDVPGVGHSFSIGEIAEATMRHELDRQRWPQWPNMVYDTQMFLSVPQSTQLYIHDDSGKPIAGMVIAQVSSVDGKLSWDMMASDAESYLRTYSPTGKIVVPVKMSVADGHEGERLPSRIFAVLSERMAEIGAEQVIGNFRPSGFAAYRWEEAQKIRRRYPEDEALQQYQKLSFTSYVSMEKDGLPLDRWLKNIMQNSRNGNSLQILRVDPKATVIHIGKDELMAVVEREDFLKVGTNRWIKNDLPGMFKVMDGSAVYTEARVWASVEL